MSNIKYRILFLGVSIALIFCFSLILSGDQCFNEADLNKLNAKLDELKSCKSKNAEIVKNLDEQIKKYKELDQLRVDKDKEQSGIIKALSSSLDIQSLFLKEKYEKKFDWMAFGIGLGSGIVVTAGLTLLIYYLK